MTCEMGGCDGWGQYRVARTSIRVVCRKCRDELTTLFGWRLA